MLLVSTYWTEIEEGQVAVSAQFVPATPRGLLAGEEPATEQVEDVDHWIAVYEELVAGARRLLAIAPEPDVRIAAELRRLQERLAYWRVRRSALARLS